MKRVCKTLAILYYSVRIKQIVLTYSAAIILSKNYLQKFTT